MKHIAIICEYILFPNRIGGMDRFFKAFDSELKKQGYIVTWFFKNVEPFDFYENLDIKSANNKNIEHYFLSYCTENKLTFQIVITHFLQPISPFFKAVKQLMNPYIINVDHNPRPLDGFPLKKRIKNKVKGWLYGNYVDKLVGVSYYTKNCIINDFGITIKKKTTVVHNGIDISDYKKQQLNRLQMPLKFIVVSHLRKSKGIQDLLEAIHSIDRAYYKYFEIDIFGDGEYKQHLISLQKKYNLEQIVHFKGNSPNLNKIFYQYHYLLQPTYMECFSLSILESLASNVPVITTTVGGNPEIIKNGINGYLFEPKDIIGLKTIIFDLITTKNTITDSVNLEIEKNYTLDIMVNNHLKLLECT